jgi:hypothetical protein
MYGALTVMETTALMASNLRQWGDTITPLLAPWTKTDFDNAQILFATFFHFLRIGILELKAT